MHGGDGQSSDRRHQCSTKKVIQYSPYLDPLMPMWQTLSQALIQCTKCRPVKLIQVLLRHTVLSVQVQQTGVVRRLGILKLQQSECLEWLSRSAQTLRIDNSD